MKRYIYFLSFILWSISFITVSAHSTESQSIELDKGNTGGTGGGGLGVQAMSFAIQPIYITVYDNNIQLAIRSDLGLIEIKIQDIYGITVYNQSVNAISGSLLKISTFGLESGNYVIKITHADGSLVQNQKFIVN